MLAGIGEKIKRKTCKHSFPFKRFTALLRI